MQKLSASVFALCLGVGSTVHAAPTTTRFVQKGASAQGFASVDDPTGCIRSGFFISAAESTAKDETGSTSTTSLLVSFFGADDCQQTNWGADQLNFPLTVPIGTGTFTYDANVPIRLVNTAAGHEEDPAIILQFTAHIVITPNGDLEKSRSNMLTKTGNSKTKVRFRGLTRDADVAVTNAKFGTATVTFLPGTGEVGTTKNANIAITKP
jgi:hypothetical protein